MHHACNAQVPRPSFYIILFIPTETKGVVSVHLTWVMSEAVGSPLYVQRMQAPKIVRRRKVRLLERGEKKDGSAQQQKKNLLQKKKR